jgi:hypothetical protein
MKAWVVKPMGVLLLGNGVPPGTSVRALGTELWTPTGRDGLCRSRGPTPVGGVGATAKWLSVQL